MQECPFARRLSVASLVVGLAVLSLLSFSSAPAHAQSQSVELCNETSYFLRVATAIRSGGASRSQGWLLLVPGDCITSAITAGAVSEAYVHAVSDPAHIGAGLIFDGRERFCTDAVETDFQIDGRRECRARGFRETSFAPIDLRGKSPKVTFSESEEYSKQQARTAGLQRLLQENGYEIVRIDGVAGRQTDRILKKYLADRGLSDGLSTSATLTKLFEDISRQQADRGLRICNKTPHLVWAATGQVTQTGFSSRGWLRVAPDQCTTAINAALKERFYFTYAEAVDANGTIIMEGGRQKIWSGDFDMCVKTTRFVINGTSDCEERGFERFAFTRIDTGDALSWTLTLE